MMRILRSACFAVVNCLLSFRLNKAEGLGRQFLRSPREPVLAIGLTLVILMVAISTPSAWKDSGSFPANIFRGLGYVEGRTKGPEERPGAHSIFGSNSFAMMVLNAPTNLSLTSASSASINLTWTPPGGAVSYYQVERSPSLSGTFSVIATPSSNTYSDTTVSSDNAYLYRVRAVDSSGVPSQPSTMALGTAITFTDDPLVVNATSIKAQHLSELRQSVNAVRNAANLSAASWTDTTLAGVTIKAVHIQELRDRLGEALSALGISPGAYTDPSLTAGITFVKKVHIEELRLRSTRGSSDSSGFVFEPGDSASSRLDPTNRTGGSGEDPLSRNFNWSVPLLGLPGRAGLDLALTLSYNSLVWTRSGPNISFDDDRGFPSAGFRLGFPVVQPRYFNAQVGKYSFMLITPNGERVEFRQVNTSSLYEAADSSYMTLVWDGANTITLRPSDGNQLSYEWKGSDFQCIKIQDRNGNFISINYTGAGRIDTIVDTLSRTIKFNYTNGSLDSITQIWNQGTAQEQTHEWASFTYNPSLVTQTLFSGVTNVGPQNGSTIKVLTSVRLNNNSSRFDFDYTSWGQVWKITNFAADGHLLNYRAYNLPGSLLQGTSAQDDCPRFTAKHDLAEDWNRSYPLGAALLPAGGEQEVVTTYAVPAVTTWTLPDGVTTETGIVAQVNQPDGTYNKLYFAGTEGTSNGWKRGLESLVETYAKTTPDPGSPIIKQRSLVSRWRQDDENVSYPVNPRVEETNVYDFNASGQIQNRARKTMTYLAISVGDGTTCHLPQDVSEYQANATTVLRRTHTAYVPLVAAYSSRRIIALVSEKTFYGVDPNTQTETLMSKVGFAYDEGSIQGNDAPVQHDNTNYNSSFVVGRGNLTSVKRYDVAPGSSAFLLTSTFYDTSGSVVKNIDPANHQTLFNYADQFSANGSTLDSARPATFAYPTTVTDPDNYTARSRFHYDLGAETWKESPQPNTTANLPGPQQTITYDSFGRVLRTTNLANGAYTRFVYPSSQPGSQNRVDTYAAIVDGASEQNGNEAHSFKIFDGYGRIIADASAHPGSIGGFNAQLVLYDVMGRAVKKANRTETYAAGTPTQWVAAGDDAPTGWFYTVETLDWKGRPVITTKPDNTTKLASYSGCGCAGGEVVTLADEVVQLPPQSGAGAWSDDRRTRKVYSDVLGRVIKSETLNRDGTPYATTVTEYNSRDQVTAVKEYKGAATLDGSCPAGTCQLTTTGYDGYGRMKTQHVPEQNAGTQTTWDYNHDDTILKVTDARGASKTYGYNARRLVTSITYAWPSGGTVPTPASFGYDAAGNRTSLSDYTGSVAYHYDQLSRMDWEERTFAGVGGSYRLSYTYNLGGQVTSIMEPSQFGTSVSYAYDATGRLSGITGSGFAGGVSQFASNMKYRAWGVLKEMTYGNGLKLDNGYNSNLQISSYQVKVPGTPAGQDERARSEYQYEGDGRIRFALDRTDPGFDRSYLYDLVGRLAHAYTGSSAYYEDFMYDEFDNMVSRGNGSWRHYDTTVSQFTNNRNTQTTVWPPSYPTCCPPQPSFWTHDAEGNVKTDHNKQYTYDAEGNKRLVFENTGSRMLWIYQDYDADGVRVKRVEQSPATVTTYYLRSSVLDDGVVTELSESGQKRETNVYSHGTILARQRDNQVRWVHLDPVTSSLRQTIADGSLVERLEVDPLGNDAPLVDPQPPDNFTPDYEYTGNYGSSGNPYDGPSGCMIDGQQVPCSMAMQVLAFGTGVGRDGGSVFVRYHDSWRGIESNLNPHGIMVIQVPGSQVNRQQQEPERSKESQECDDRLAKIFGDGKGAFATDKELSSLRSAKGRNRLGVKGEDPRQGVGHLYASKTGEGSVNSYAYTPPGFFDQGAYAYPRYFGYDKHLPTSQRDYELQNDRFYNYAPGSLQSYGYSGGLQIHFIHTGPTDKNMKPLPVNQPPNERKSVAVGVIGGFGNIVNGELLDPGGAGQGGGDVHVHMKFSTLTVTRNRKGKITSVKRGKSIDPRKVFCSDLGFK